jgi:KDO2-lipid IV(A) lauroyltransferase
MNKAATWFFSFVAVLINAMPHRMRYAFSDIIAFALRKVLRYRCKEVRKNLLASYPHKKLSEIFAIEKRFYRNLGDIFIESLQLLTIKPENLLKRFSIQNKGLIDTALENNKGVFLAIGHAGNWEWFAAFLSLLYPGRVGALYKEQRSKVFDALFYRMRTRLGGLVMFESKIAYRALAAKSNNARVVIIPGDQTPGGKPTDHWTMFMHQETPFFTGLEKMANSLGFAVFFVDLQRKARGHYVAVVEKLEPVSQTGQQFGLTEAYAQRLERALMEAPDNWLWSHRRWKHKRKKTVG